MLGKKAKTYTPQISKYKIKSKLSCWFYLKKLHVLRKRSLAYLPQQSRRRSPCPASPVQTCSQRLFPFASSFSSCLDSCQEAAVCTFQTPARRRLQVSTTSSPVASTPCKSPSRKPSEPDSEVKRGTTI